jgi:hypothetical protein
MSSAMTIEDLAEAMYTTVKEAAGVKKLSANDLTKLMVERFAGQCTRDTCKQAIRQLMDSGRCTYTYFGGTYVEVAPEERANA